MNFPNIIPPHHENNLGNAPAPIVQPQPAPAQAIFQATYPQNFNPPVSCRAKAWKAAKIILAIIIIPIGIAWVAKKILCLIVLCILKKTFGGIEQIILPALAYNKDDALIKADCERRDSIFANPNSAVYRTVHLELKTPDGVILDGALIWRLKEKEAADEYKKNGSNVFQNSNWIIKCNGNGEFYESKLNESRIETYSRNCNILVFNYRGVLGSEGYPRCSRDLALDCHTAYQFLDSQGANVVLEGLSLGGGNGAQAAAFNPGAHMANLKSFSSLTDCVKGIVYSYVLKDRDDEGIPRLNYHPSCMRRTAACIAACLAGWLTRNVLETANWEINTASVWNKITGRKWIVTGTHDHLMRGDGTLYKFLKRRLPGYKKVNKNNPNNASQIARNEELKKQLNSIKAKGAGHMDPLEGGAEQAHIQQLALAFGAA